MKRSLQFKHKKFKSNCSRTYNKSMFNKYVFWFIFNKYGLDNSLLFLYNKQRNQIHTYIKFFDDIEFPGNSNFEICEYIRKKLFTKECKECQSTFVSERGVFCSVTCSNVYKTKDNDFCKKLSESTKTFHKSLSVNEKEIRNKTISNGNKRFYNEQKQEETQTGFGQSYLNVQKLCAEKSLKLCTTFEEHKRTDLYKFECKCGLIFDKKRYSGGFTKSFCSRCNPIVRNKTKTQIIISSYVENCLLNDRSIGKEIDIMSFENNFGIEYDGLIWHSYGKSNYSFLNNFDKEDMYCHLKKTELCEKQNIQLYRIFENEWLNETTKQIWISKIKGKQGLHNKIYARKCYIKEITTKESKDFLNVNHLQGSCSASIKIGLFYIGELVSVMTIGKSRFNKKYEYELIRLASKLNTTVVGGASKLLKYFELTYTPKSLISYANRRWSMGNVYDTIGFTKISSTKPNYFYFKGSLMSRHKFQKHKLKDKLEFFNEELTETENMFNNGYRKIYDCGNLVYVKIYEGL